MDNTVAFEQGISTVPNRAYGHSLVDGTWVRTDQSSTSAVLGDDGIYSSIDDLAKWDAALYDDRLLSDAMRADAFSVQNPLHDQTDVDGYGYAWRLTADTIWTPAAPMGCRNDIRRLPPEHFTMSVSRKRNEQQPYR